jgi:ABC-type spermidine/putrescine transport system permease subunit II
MSRGRRGEVLRRTSLAWWQLLFRQRALLSLLLYSLLVLIVACVLGRGVPGRWTYECWDRLGRGLRHL